MSTEFDSFKNYLDAKFDGLEAKFDAKFDGLVSEVKDMKSDIREIKTELKEHRKTEAEIKVDVSVLKSKMNILMGICGAVGTGLLVGIIKYFFFT